MKAILKMILILLPMLASCDRAPLCYDHPHMAEIDIVFDWNLAPEAHPASMKVLLYNRERGNYYEYEFGNCKGGHVRVPLGQYDIITYNTDTWNILYNNMNDRDLFHITTGKTTLFRSTSAFTTRGFQVKRAEGTESEPVIETPEYVYAARISTDNLDRKDIIYTITLHPEYVVKEYTVEVRNVKNIKGVMEVSGSISSMSGSVYLFQGDASALRATHPFDATPVWDDGIIRGKFTAFGHCGSRVEAKHLMMLYVMLTDGRGYFWTYDVTDQLHLAPDQNKVHIVIESLDLPESKPGSGGGAGGFSPTVSEWEEEIIPLPMG